MTSNNPQNKPLHRVRNMRNARRNAQQFPQLASSLFNPSHAGTGFYNPRDPVWSDDDSWQAITSPYLPPQPNMHQFYTSRAANLRPMPWVSEEARVAYRAQRAAAGYVPVVKNGNNQLQRMLQVGLDPRVPPTEEEVKRRAEQEARVQVFRDRMTLDTIVEHSGGGADRGRVAADGGGSFPGWSEHLKQCREATKALTDKTGGERTDAEGKKAEAGAQSVVDLK